MTREEMIADVKDLLAEGGIVHTDRDALIIRSLNQGMRRVCQKAKFPELQRYRTYSLVANQMDYELPVDYIDEIEITHDWGLPLVHATQTDHHSATGSTPFTTNTIPYYYTFLRKGNQRFIRVYNRPDTSAETSTLEFTITAGATTLTLISSAGFPEKGRIIIDTEVIEYNNNNTAINTLEGLTRGLEDTAASAHNAVALVTDRDLQLLYFSRNGDLDDDADIPLFSEDYHTLPIYYTLWKTLLAKKKLEEAQMYKVMFDQGVLDATNDTARTRLARPGQIKPWDAYVGSTM